MIATVYKHPEHVSWESATHTTNSLHYKQRASTHLNSIVMAFLLCRNGRGFTVVRYRSLRVPVKKEAKLIVCPGSSVGIIFEFDSRQRQVAFSSPQRLNRLQRQRSATKQQTLSKPRAGLHAETSLAWRLLPLHHYYYLINLKMGVYPVAVVLQ
jgi:hypothetical protein